MADIDFDPHADRDTFPAMRRGISLKCPACGNGPMFQSYLSVAPKCTSCGEELHHQRADDAPAYFTMFIVGHIVIGLVLALEQAYAPPTWVHTIIFVPMLVILSLVLLPIVKGALIGLQWAKRMHGFGGDHDDQDVIVVGQPPTRPSTKPAPNRGSA
ncbi:MAG: DUF983 domain-containing protein [Hyphomicrobium aestuarii]|nr:DUF983 domain-containing protein [Hyphomicrobium aestuarii]